MPRTKAEHETILRYDQEEKRLHLFTAWAADARRWQRLGYPVQVTSRDREARPQGWTAVVPLACLRALRRLVDGAIVKRPGPRRNPFLGRRARVQPGSEHRIGGGPPF